MLENVISDMENVFRLNNKLLTCLFNALVCLVHCQIVHCSTSRCPHILLPVPTPMSDWHEQEKVCVYTCMYKCVCSLNSMTNTGSCLSFEVTVNPYCTLKGANLRSSVLALIHFIWGLKVCGSDLSVSACLVGLSESLISVL